MLQLGRRVAAREGREATRSVGTLTHVGQGQVQQALHHRVDADRPDAARRSHVSTQHHRILFIFGGQDLELVGDLHSRAALAEEVLPGRRHVTAQQIRPGTRAQCQPGFSTDSPTTSTPGSCPREPPPWGERGRSSRTPSKPHLYVRPFKTKTGLQAGQAKGHARPGAKHRAPRPGAAGRDAGLEEAWWLEPMAGPPEAMVRAGEGGPQGQDLPDSAPLPEPTAVRPQG